MNCVRFCFWCCDFFCLCMKYLGKRWTDLLQTHTEDVFGPSLGRVWRSRSISPACMLFMFGKTTSLLWFAYCYFTTCRPKLLPSLVLCSLGVIFVVCMQIVGAELYRDSAVSGWTKAAGSYTHGWWQRIPHSEWVGKRNTWRTPSSRRYCRLFCSLRLNIE